MKKIYLIVALFLLPNLTFCQTDKIGQSRSEILNSMSLNPCKSNGTEIWYCMQNGSLINYTFKNDVVSSVLYMWEFKTKEDANADVENEVLKYKGVYGRPEYKDGGAFWFSGNTLIHISYGYTNGKHYSCWRASIWK